MKKCGNCGKTVEDNAKFCSECRSTVFVTEFSAPAPANETDANTPPESVTTDDTVPTGMKAEQWTVREPEKKSKMPLVVIGILAALVIALIIGCAILISQLAKNDDDADEIKTEQTTLQAITPPETEEQTGQSQITDTVKESAKFEYTINLEGITTLDELEIRIEDELTSAIDSLKSQYNALTAEIDTYDKYCKNPEKVSDFYTTIIDSTGHICIMLKEYTAAYARMILDSDMNNNKKYDAAEGIEDAIYDDACDMILDEIYNGILDDMIDYYYNGIIDDGLETSNWDDWSDISSNEYIQWSDAASDVYKIYSDASSDIYSLYSDLASELYSGDTERAEKKYEKFLQQIAKDKGLGTAKSD